MITTAQRKEYMRKYHAQHRDDIRLKRKQWQSKNKDKVRQYSCTYSARHTGLVSARNKAYYAENKINLSAAHAGYYVKHALEAIERAAVWRKANPEKQKACVRKWKDANRGKVNAAWEKRRATKLQATPPWLTVFHFEAIEQFYVEAARLQAVDGIKRHVDHIYPLQGKTVCGLHVPWNLQILEATANLSKGNKLVVK
jgi:hypothetical protein